MPLSGGRALGVERPRLVVVPGQGQVDAAREPEARPPGHHGIGQQTDGLPILRYPVAHPQAHAAGPLEDLPRQSRIAAGHRMAHAGDDLAASGERARDPPMDRSGAHGVLPEPLRRAVRSDQGVQTPNARATGLHRLQQAVQHTERAYARQRIPRQHFRQQRFVHPAEQAQIQDQIPVLRPKGREQTRLDPIAGQVIGADAPGSGRFGVAGHA